jgi:hypothetical protein
MISGRAVARQAARLSAPGSRVLTAEEVFGASSDEPRLDRLVSEFVTELAFHVVNLAIALNPARIAVGGGMVGSWDRLRPGLAGALDAGTPFPPELVPARFPDDAPLRGAVALAVDAAAAIPARASAGDGDGDTAARRDSATRSDSPNGSQPPNRTHSDTDSGSTAGGVAPVPHRPGTLTERLQS